MITVKDSTKYLMSLLPQKVDRCAFKLSTLIIPIQAIRAIQTYFPEDYQVTFANKFLHIETIMEEYEIEETVIDIIDKHIPLSDNMLENFREGDKFSLWIQPFGPQWSYDTFMEDLENMQELNPEIGPDIFIQMLDHEYDDYWEEAIEYFGWPLKGPPDLPKYSWYFDLDELCDKFKTNRLSRLRWLWRVNCWSTGNVFFDFNAMDESTLYSDRFEPESIPMLLQQVKQAKRIQSLYNSATKMVLDNPDLISVMLNLFKECIHAREEKDSEG